MLSTQAQDQLTLVGPGTAMGDLMRCYWHPIAAAAQLDDEPVRPVKLLGESLVLYRDGRGGLGLLAERCAHRGASLGYGVPEDAGLRCPYHGWMYDARGQCIERPAEEYEGSLDGRIAIQAYPVKELGGLIFAYLGPEPAPLLPSYPGLVWERAVRQSEGMVIPCNWLQVVENLLDPVHVQWLHGRYFAHLKDREGPDRLREFLDYHAPAPVQSFSFDPFQHGIIQRYVLKATDGHSEDHGQALFFPATTMANPAPTVSSLVFVVPLDDTHTWFLEHVAQRSDRQGEQTAVPYFEVHAIDEAGRPMTGTANGQDYMVVVTQGEVARRDLEHLGRSDVGIIRYRRLLAEQSELVADGGQPMNVLRDPAENEIIELPTPDQASGPGHDEVVLELGETAGGVSGGT